MSAIRVNDSGFTDFEEARQALILRYYHNQPDFQTFISQPRDNSLHGNQTLTIDINGCCIRLDPVYLSELARKSQYFPKMETMVDFARQYMLLLAQWNQKDLFEKKQIRDFVHYIEARKGSFMVPINDAQIYNSNVTLLSLPENTTVQPWTYGNEPFVRELADSYFNKDLKNRT